MRHGRDTWSAKRRLSRGRSTALIIADAGLGHVLLHSHIARPWRRSITVHHPLEVIRCLQDESHAIATIFYPLSDPAFEAGGLSVFLADQFPSVRRIGYGKEGAVHQVSSTTGALAEDAGLVRLRVSALVGAMGFSDEDAEDIVQDTLLGLFVGRGGFSGVDMDALVALTAKTASNRERGNQRRTRLRVAAVSEAATCRSSRESTERPDAALLTVELADLASTAVGDLPSCYRGPFRLRVLQEQSAMSAGAALGMLPATVDMWVAQARQRIDVLMRQHLA